MSDLPDPRDWYVLIVTSLRDAVFSPTLRELLLVAGRGFVKTPDYLPACRAALAKVERLDTDADLSHWIHHRAAVPEVFAVELAVAQMLGLAQHPTPDNQLFATMVDSLRQELSLRNVARLGLRVMIETDDRDSTL